MAHFEKELERQEVYRGCIFTLTSHRVGLENGGESRRDIVNHHGGACVAALDEEGRVLLVRQYRFGVKEELLELPAGKLEEGEDPAASLTKLTELLPTPAYCTERIYLYQAHGLTKGEQRLDRDEFLDVVALPLAEALELVLAGKLPDAKTQAGILLLARQQGI